MPTPAPARWWSQTDDGRVLCTLCPRYCRLGDGQAGFCYVRQNQGGALVSLAWGTSTGFAIDPIEKKPLNHFLPGTPILSFGTAGCNLGCRFCQNWSISKARLTQTGSLPCTPADVVRLAQRERCPSIAFTYNDPVIFGEWMDDIGREARAAGIRTVAVTAGYCTESARAEVFRHVDALNVDLKGFTERFYRKLSLGHLEPVLEFLAWVHQETTAWLEVTTLVIPGWNDDRAELTAQFEWMVKHLGPDVPLHLTAFHPDFKLRDVPRTPPQTLSAARALAHEIGLRYVYTGNVRDTDGQTTRCPACSNAVIARDWHVIERYDLRDTNRCGRCGHTIAGVFQADHPFQHGRPDDRYHGGQRSYLSFSKKIFGGS